MCCRPVWLRLLPLLLLLLLMLPNIAHPAARTLPTSGQQQHMVDAPASLPHLLIFIQNLLTHFFNPSHSLFLVLPVFPNSHLCSPSCTFLFLSPPFSPDSTMQSWESTMQPPVSQWPFRGRAKGRAYSQGKGQGWYLGDRLNIKECVFKTGQQANSNAPLFSDKCSFTCVYVSMLWCTSCS